LIALVALGGLLPAATAEPASPVLKDESAAMASPAQDALYTTASMAAFLNDSWTPTPFAAPLASQAVGTLKNMTRNNTTQKSSTYSIYDFLNDNYTSPSIQSPTYSAAAAGKDMTVAWTGESIYDFLKDTWSPSSPVQTFDQTPYKMHQMN